MAILQFISADSLSQVLGKMLNSCVETKYDSPKYISCTAKWS